jgi:5-methylthioadenosine/S-adenosylhomocysteine deaminase
VDVELLIKAGWVVPAAPPGCLAEHAVAIADGRIAAILPSADTGQIRADRQIDLPGHVLLPGLINAHTHSPMSLFRGLADDLPLMTWLHDHIWPAEAQWVREDFVADGTRLAIAEMLRSGTTCFNDMYFFPDVTGRVAAQAGIRATVGLIVIDFPSAWAGDTDGYFDRAAAVHDQFRGSPLIRTAFAPHAPYSVGDQPIARVATLANELELPVHIHVHETQAEVEGSLQTHGKRPLARLQEAGLLTPSLVAVHMTQLDDGEIETLAECGAKVVHCPQSNLKLASGACPVGRLRDAGVTVALGTDGAASNNDLDMLAELQSAALFAKGHTGDSCRLPADEAIAMATIAGARALGIDDFTGSLTVGKSADLIAVDLDTPETQPVYNPISQLVYAAGREQVTHVWVRGQMLLNERKLMTLDLPQVLDKAREWQRRIAGTSC